MTADLPAWIPAEPGSSPSLPVTEGRVGRVVSLLSSEGALAGGWAGAVAVDLADAWSHGGARVVVIDAGLSTPLLHEALDIPNGEGLVDALRWGASVQRVVQRPEGRSFLAVTAGTAVADGVTVMSLPRWPALCEGFREAGVTVVVLVPAWEDALDAVLAETDEMVVLAEPDEDLAPLIEDFQGSVIAVMGRAAPSEDPVPEDIAETVISSEDAPEADTVPDGEDEADEVTSWGTLADDGAPPFLEPESADPVDLDASVGPEGPEGSEGEAAPVPALASESDAEAADDVDAPADMESGLHPDVPEVAAVASPGAPDSEDGITPMPEEPAADAVSGAGPATGVAEAADSAAEDEFVLPDPIPVPPSLEEIVEESEKPAKRGRSGLLLLLVFLVVAAVAVAAWLGYLEIPGLTPTSGTASSVPVPTAVAMVPATEDSPLEGYSLALGAYQDGIVAGQRVADLATAVPGVLFQAVPVEINGTLFHRVLAGPASDSAGAVALASRIAEVASLDPSPWVVRWTPLAFQLGELPDMSAAARRVGALNDLGVSAYTLAVDYSDGSTRYRVFAGAFADEAEASYLSGLLDERGLSSATLSDRTGRLPE